MNNKFLTNYSEITFLDYIITSLNNCKSFCFSVSFIKIAGLVLLEDAITYALERGVEGKIITSTYQNFTDAIKTKISQDDCFDIACNRFHAWSLANGEEDDDSTEEADDGEDDDDDDDRSEESRDPKLNEGQSTTPSVDKT